MVENVVAGFAEESDRVRSGDRGSHGVQPLRRITPFPFSAQPFPGGVYRCAFMSCRASDRARQVSLQGDQSPVATAPEATKDPSSQEI